MVMMFALGILVPIAGECPECDGFKFVDDSRETQVASDTPDMLLPCSACNARGSVSLITRLATGRKVARPKFLTIGTYDYRRLSESQLCHVLLQAGIHSEVGDGSRVSKLLVATVQARTAKRLLTNRAIDGLYLYY